jgi:anti-anti-sigma factor
VESHFRVNVHRDERATVLALSGELDLASGSTLEQELQNAIRSDAETVILDLRELDFIDSTGLSIIVKASQHADEAGKRFGVVRGGPQVERLLDLTGLTGRLATADSPEELMGGG